MFDKIILNFILIVFWCDALSLDPCENHKTCDKCIRDPNNCVWCSKEDWKETRCRSMYPEDWCTNHTINPTSRKDKVDDRPFTSDLGKTVQIKPQQYKFNLRIGQEINFNFSYYAAKDYPVDLYFLIDVSVSMKSIKAKTANQSEKIYFTISNLTNNVFLGLGTFVDKNALPFTSYSNSNLTYSFRHQLNMTNSYQTFKQVLNDVPLGNNIDLPEGGLDALAQVMVCKEEIGWRQQSRKIIVLLTDDLYHGAGDGRIAGIVKPYDGKCYTKGGIYLNELSMDYPSVSMINKLARDEQIIIVFAVQKKVQGTYQKLSSFIRNSYSITYDSTDMAMILKDIYEKITHHIKLDVRSQYHKKIEISFKPDCLRNNNNNCNVLKGQEMEFVGTLKLLGYEADNILVDILVGGMKEHLTLNIDVINKCDCVIETNSTTCSTSGNRKCGICECQAGRYGDNCECTATSDNSLNDDSLCYAPNQTEICSGRGLCHCGSCDCKKGYSGRYCECNNDNCKLDASGNLCGGHGVCSCGICTCSSSEWIGDACDCYKPETPCINNGKLCNNRGICKCGACECHKIAQWDTRFYEDKFCRVTAGPDYHTNQCRKLEDCARCRHSGNANCSNCYEITKINVTKTLSDFNTTDTGWNTCYFERKGVCYSIFMYRYDDDNYSIEMLVQTEVNCAETYYKFGGIFLFALIVIGIGTLIAWKLITDARDRREYEQFQKQREEDIVETRGNPCFRPPTMSFSNPAFRKRSINRF